MSSTITVQQDPTGQPTVVMAMDPALADWVMTVMARQRAAEELPADALHMLDPLYLAVSQAFDLAAPDTTAGCPDLWPDAAPMPLTEPALLGSVDGGLLAALVPGQPDPCAAIALAVETAKAAGHDIDERDESLIAEVFPARWMVLSACDSDEHDFHPSLAPQGPRTTGAVLVTRVDITLA